MTWKVILDPTGRPQVEHHALVGLNATILFSTEDYKRAKAFREEWIVRRAFEEANDKCQKELF